VVLDGTAEKAKEMYKLFAKEIFPKKAEDMDFMVKGLVFNEPLHKDTGLNHVLDQAFGDLTLEQLATRIHYDYINDQEVHVASLLVPAYDLTYRRPVAFMVDRYNKEARFLGIDPFSGPFMGGGFPVLRVGENVMKDRFDLLKSAYDEYVRRYDDVPFNLSNLGEAQLPVQKNLPNDYIRYQKKP
jgi:hypothetical protein